MSAVCRPARGARGCAGRRCPSQCWGFTADMVVPGRVEDDYGVIAEAAITSLQCELAFRINPKRGEHLEIVHESLRPLRVTDSRRDLGFPSSRPFRESAIRGRRTTALMSTKSGSISSTKKATEGAKFRWPNRPVWCSRAQTPTSQLPSFARVESEVYLFLENWKAGTGAQ